jgi:hypothetical protein
MNKDPYEEIDMRTYLAFYRGMKIVVQANSSYEAQTIAASQLKAKKSYQVAIVLADTPINTASI